MTEQASRKRLKKGAVQDAVLSAVALSGILLIAMAAPNVLQLLRYVPGNKYRFAHQTKTSLARLAERGLIRFVERRGKKYAQITSAGEQHLAIREACFALHGNSRKWDRRWRVVIFDIPEKRRNVRDQLRNRMRRLGFFRLQDSAWIYPHDCEDIISLIKAELRVGHAVIYMSADIENDHRLREHFSVRG